MIAKLVAAVRALVVGVIHALLYAAMTLGMGAWLCAPEEFEA